MYMSVPLLSNVWNSARLDNEKQCYANFLLQGGIIIIAAQNLHKTWHFEFWGFTMCTFYDLLVYGQVASTDIASQVKVTI